MAIKVGDRIPDGTLYKFDENGVHAVQTADMVDGRKVVVFGLPAAFSRTCSAAHLPSFMRTREGFAEKGVEDIYCISVNDGFTMAAWDKEMGAGDAGISLLGDASGEFTKALGMDFDFPQGGMFGRSKRYALVAEDGVVTHLNEEVQGGVCELTAGEKLLEKL
ncbi:peroxiredoxin [Alisedimentitalea sp. MJ-SS2]|uniref:peroxiredoxin n=1 Tax=Aliisedimentitalea sp. MJ-SS2 TaxID=3049795 RepID=UPI00290C2A94|nr:peroxiredoxin [Alisedimentitalea sp. MJ-SS2]MDU8927622.1 peroxiredoxin [Alisedimentitalea sp. MJ-SS2]